MRSFLVLLPLLAPPLCGCASGSPGRNEAERRIEALERENANLRERIATIEQWFARNDVICSLPTLPPIDGQVLDVDKELRLVVLDKGARDGVKVAYTFDLYLGSTYKGHVQVTEVRETTCTARIVNEKNAIAPGDSASTTL